MDELTPEETQRFDEHLAQCTRCQQEYDEVRELRVFVESSFGNEPNQTSQTSRRPRHTNRLAWVGLTAAVMFATFTVLSQNSAFAARFHETAHDLRSGISHPTIYLRTEAQKIMETHFRLRPKNVHGSPHK